MPEGSQADAVDDLESAVLREGQGPWRAATPRAHGGGLRLVDVELQKRAGIDIGPLTARHG